MVLIIQQYFQTSKAIKKTAKSYTFVNIKIGGFPEDISLVIRISGLSLEP